MIIGIHGIRDSGGTTTELLTSYLSSKYGLNTVDFDYPPVRIWNAEKRLDENAMLLMSFVEACHGGAFKSIDIAAHSYGALIVYRALELDRTLRLNHLHLIAPAMRRDADWGRYAHKFNENGICCYVNPWDIATRAASLSHLIAPRMGSAGHKGFKDSSVVRNHYRKDRSGIWNHSRAWFDRDGLTYLGHHMAGTPCGGGA